MGMRILTKMLIETVVYWGTPYSDGRGGVTTDAPVELDARWDDMIEEFTDPAGNTCLSRAVVYTESLDGGVGAGEDLKVGGFLYRGTLASLQDTKNPEQIDAAYEIRKVGRTPTLSGTQFLRTSWL